MFDYPTRWQDVPAATLRLRDQIAGVAKEAAARLGPLVGDSTRVYLDGAVVVIADPDNQFDKLAEARAAWPDGIAIRDPVAGDVPIKTAAAAWALGRGRHEEPWASPAALTRAMVAVALPYRPTLGLDPGIKVAADDSPSGAFFTQPIPVDSFNQAIWTDAIRPGYRGSTPLPVAATASAILQGAAANAGRPAVTPWEIAISAATGAGTGYLSGMAAGKVMGTLGLMSPQSQRELQRAGLWSGMLTGALKPLFDDR